ncbi:MAG: TonB-dependent receptor [Bacteroidetes bacterium]|nr:TonB-dependent receptor [Bacteroidota bacterium]
MLISAALVRAQERIQGVVIDAHTKAPVVGLTVAIETADHQRIHVRPTSTDGRYDFPLSIGAAYIHISGLGYADTVFAIGHVLFRAIELQPVGGRMDEVVVTAQRHTTLSQDVPVSVSTATAAELTSRGSIAVDDALRWIPGVSVTESQVNIRGSSGYGRGVGSRVLFMLDGMPLLAADNGDIKFDVVPLLDIDRIEVVKGAGSALYGSSALGGIINVITRPTSDTLSIGAVVLGGIYDQPKYSEWRVPTVGSKFASGEVGASGTVGQIGLLGTLAVRRNEGYRLGDDSYKVNGFAKASVPLGGAATWTTSLLAANENHGGWLYWKGLSTPLLPADSLGVVNGRIHSAKENVQSSIELLSDAVSHTFRLDLYHTQFTTDPSVPGGQPGAHSSALNTTGEYDLNTDLSSLYLTAGAIGSYQRVTSDLFTDHSGVSISGYAQAEWHISPAIVTTGFRADAIRHDAQNWLTQVSPKLGVSYAVDEHISMRGSIGSGFRAPTISEQYIDQVFGVFPVRPNPLLVPERSLSSEIGGSYRGQNLFVDAAIFYTRFQHLIEPTFVTGSSASYIQFQNITDADIFGHEEAIEWHPFSNDELSARLAYTYVYPRNRQTNAILEYRPRHLLQTRLGTQWGKWEGSADFRYVSQYESVDSVLSRQVPDGGARVNAYVLDARISRDMQDVTGLPAKLTFQVENLLNYYYVEIVGNVAPLRSYSVRIETAF